MTKMVVTMKSGRTYIRTVDGEPTALADTLGNQLATMRKDQAIFFWYGSAMFMFDAVEAVTFERGDD